MATATTTATKDLNNHLDSLRRKLREYEARLALIDQDRAFVGRKIAELNAEIAEVKQKLKKVTISEHALLRYLERVMGVSVEEMKAAIQRELPDYIPDGRFTVHDITFVVRDNTLVTVYR